MFKELTPLVAKGTVLLIVAPIAGGNLRVTFSAKAKDSDKAAFAPLVVEGSPEELDQDLPAAIIGFVAKNLTLSESLAKADEEMVRIETERKKEVEEARKKKTPLAPSKPASATVKPTAVTPVKVPEPDLFAQDDQTDPLPDTEKAVGQATNS